MYSQSTLLYKLYNVNCLQNVRTNNNFLKEIKTYSFEKQSIS